jgi:hypothetical protein
VVDLATGEELWAHEADGDEPASNAKLLTPIAALGTLGSGFAGTRPSTRTLDEATGVVAGDLYIRGKGDPMLSGGPARARGEVAARGVRTVEAGSHRRRVLRRCVEPPRYDEQKNERAGFARRSRAGKSRSAISIVASPSPVAARRWVDPDAGDYVKIVMTKSSASPRAGRAFASPDPSAITWSSR